LLSDAVVFYKAFSAKPMNTRVSSMVFSAKWYQRFVVSLTPSSGSQVVEFNRRWIMVAM
jgi:hypothetical protein